MNRVFVSIANALARVGYVIAAAMALYMFAPNARADVLSDFLTVYKDIEKVAPADSLPLHSWDIEASKGLFSCLNDSHKDTAGCIAEFHSTPLGQQAATNNGLPKAFWDFLDAYVAYLGHDYWGVAYHLGSTATCAALQVLMGGIDACSLIEEVVELAKDIYEGGKAVAEFFADLGEGTFKVAKAAYCATPLSVFGGCSGSGTSAKPKVVAIYDTYFKPNLHYGLQAIKSDNSETLRTLVKTMKSQALAKGHATNDVDSAASAFYQAVDVLWYDFVLDKLLPDLTLERAQYNKDHAHIDEATLHAWKRYTTAKTLPAASVPSHCDDHFNTLDYDQFTRWIIAHAQKALDLKLLTVHRWCDEAFWKGNQGLFAQAFLGPNAAGSVCPGLHCPTQKELALCQPFMASVGKKCAIAASLPDGSAAKVDDKVVPPAAGAAKWPAGGTGTTAIAKPALADLVPPPARAASAAPGQTRPPNWGAISQPQNGLTVKDSPTRGDSVAPGQGRIAVAQAANAATANAARIGAELAKVRCTAGAGGLRFLCASREGFERCEAMRARREVDFCALNGAR